MKKLLLLLFMMSLISCGESDSSFSKNEKVEAKSLFIKNCFNKQRQANVNKDMSNNQISSYCSCVGSEVLKAPNVKKVLRDIGNGHLPPTHYNNLLLAAGTNCAKQVVK